jgi:ribA/ribD-fused uncharacterized protein
MTIERFEGMYEPFSNFGPGKVRVWNIEFPRSEHAFQAAKTLDLEVRQQIAVLPTPGAAKRFGRAITLRPGWDRMKKQVMLQVLLLKFIQNPKLGELLASTRPEFLVEGNTWHDNYWGRCMCTGCTAGMVPAQNYLGRLLMAVRDVVTVDEGA